MAGRDRAQRWAERRRLLLAPLLVVALSLAAGSPEATGDIGPFGNTGTGTASTYASPDYKFVSRFTLGEKGTVQKLSAYLRGSGTSGTQATRALIYADAAGVPGALAAVSDEVSIPYSAPKQWVDFGLPTAVTLPPGTYWLGLHAGPRSGDALVYYSYSAVTGAGELRYDPYADGPSDPFGTGTAKDRSISIYATYVSADPVPPTATSPPTVSGSFSVGATLGAATGAWTGSQPISYSYQWRRCDSSGAACSDIAGATGLTYMVGSADAGKTLRFAVTATNSAASTIASSAATAVIGTDPVIAAAGDIACDPIAWNFYNGVGTAAACRQKFTAALLNPALAALLPLGDEQYECGPLAAFKQVYDPTWGVLKSKTHPILGNHEYMTNGDLTGIAHTSCDSTSTSPAHGYFAYFGSAAGSPDKGYYSYDLGSWHLIALNSNCVHVGGCGLSSPQERWLRNDLRKNTAPCTLAYWHHPFYNSNGLGNATYMQALWQDLYSYGAEIVLSGHAHDYERFAPQDAAGHLDLARGIREFVVGTGGKSHSGAAAAFLPNSELWNDDTYGVLELTLHRTSYAWKFLPEPGKSFTDSGSGACH